MFILTLLLLQGTLPDYSVTVDPVYLQQLYANPIAELEVPAEISFNGESGDCTLAFRGGTSLWCVKKSWHIRIDDPDLIPSGEHLLLNAQFRDPSLMRNTLGLYMTRKLGFPAPETEFVNLSINGEYMGVYEQLERIDRLFYERNGLSFGPLFKNVDVYGRFAEHFSDTTGLAGFEPKIDSSPYGNQLLELIEACFRNDVSSLCAGEILAAYAVHTAIGDQDGIIKNFYLHKSNDIWHYYPWDRDATFGNSWTGEYGANWVTRSNLGDIGFFGATPGIFSIPENMYGFNQLLNETSLIFRDDLPQMVDSIRLLIREDLALDPYYEYSLSQLDSLCNVIQQDVENRADYLGEMPTFLVCPKIDEISISSPLDMESRIKIHLTLENDDAVGVVCLVAFDREEEQWFYMEQDTGDEGEWEIEIPVVSGAYAAHFSFGPISSSGLPPIFYPGWGIRGNYERWDPTPSARVALANLSPESFSPGTPLWCGDNLWVVPVTNTASEVQDISLCGFSLGEPAGNIFLPESLLVAPGETFYLTNSAENATDLYPANNLYGDAGTSFPSGTTLKLFNPAWDTIQTWEIGSGDSLPDNPGLIIPSEISAGEGSDWIELYNFSENGEDLSGWYLIDSEKNISLIPEGTSLPPGGLLLVAADPVSFDETSCEVVLLEFALNSLEDSLSLYSSLGTKEFSMGWDELWPFKESGIIYLTAPQATFALPGSWEVSNSPGSPGYMNPGWSGSSSYTRIYLVSDNPSNGSFIFNYNCSSIATEAILYDMAGRSIARMDLPENYQGEVAADFSGILPNGVYILYLRSYAGSASTRFTVLK